MKWIFIIAGMFGLALFGSAKKDNCETTFTVIDCQKQPMAEVTIQVERCRDQMIFIKITDHEGVAIFPLCKDSICNPKVTVVGFTDLPKKYFHWHGNSCTIKLCP
jgi:hypothetical protein